MAVVHHNAQRKSHYIQDGQPICGAYLREPGPLEKQRPATADDCMRCRKKLRRR